MKLHYKMFSVSIAFTLNVKTYCDSQEGFLCPFLFLILSPFAFFSSVFPIPREFTMDFIQEYLQLPVRLVSKSAAVCH